MRIASFFVAGAVLLGSAPFEDASAQWRKRARKDEPRSQTPIACTPPRMRAGRARLPH